MLVTGQKLLASEQSNIQLFLVLCWYLETGQEISSAQKIQWNNHKGKRNIYIYYLFIYLFIYYLLFIIYLFLILFRHGLSVFFYNSKLGPHLHSTQGALTATFVFAFFTNPQIWPTRSTFLQSSVLTLIKQHPSMLIKFFRIFRKPQVGELVSRLKLKSAAHLPSISIFEEPWFIYLWMKKEGLVDMLFCFFTVEW